MIQVNKHSLRHLPSARGWKKKELGGILNSGSSWFARGGKSRWRELGLRGPARLNHNLSPSRRGSQPRAGPSTPVPASAPSPAQPPARRQTSRSRLPVAPRCLPEGSPSTVAAVRAPPRGRVRRARQLLSGPPQHRPSREMSAEYVKCGRRREGLLTVAAGSAPDLGVGRAPLCFSADCFASVRGPELRGRRRWCCRCERDAPCSLPAREQR